MWKCIVSTFHETNHWQDSQPVEEKINMCTGENDLCTSWVGVCMVKRVWVDGLAG